MRKVGNEIGARMEEMRIAMNNEFALMRGHDFRFLQDFSGRDFAWLVIGVLLTAATIWILSRQRRRWF
jgi:hypothetical protein